MKYIKEFKEFTIDNFIKNCIKENEDYYSDVDISEAEKNVDDTKLKKLNLYYLIRYTRTVESKGELTLHQKEVIEHELRYLKNNSVNTEPRKDSIFYKAREKDPGTYNKYIKLGKNLYRKFTEIIKDVNKGLTDSVINKIQDYEKINSDYVNVSNNLIDIAKK